MAGLFIAAAVTCAWRGRRRLLVACALPAAAAVIWLLIHQPAYNSNSITVWTLSAGQAGIVLLCLAALVLLTRQPERPPRSWLWLIGLIIATGSPPGLLQSNLLVGSWVWPALLLTIIIVPIAWIVVDARPALGPATCLALYVVARLGDTVRLGNSAYYASPVLALAEAMWPVYAVLLPVGGLALWRLHHRQAVRQSIDVPNPELLR